MHINCNGDIIPINGYSASDRVANVSVSRCTPQHRIKTLINNAANSHTNMFKPVAMLMLGITAAYALSTLVSQFNAAYAADMDRPCSFNAMIRLRPQDQCEAYHRIENQVECEKIGQNPSHVMDVILTNGIRASDVADIIKSMDEHYRTLLHIEKQAFFYRAVLCSIIGVIIGIFIKNCVPFR